MPTPAERGLPPLAAEDHVCEPCRLAFDELTVQDAAGLIAATPGRLADALEAVQTRSPSALRSRPEPSVWAPVEYACHVRDVHVAFTIRLHRARIEHQPSVEPMFNDLRARRFAYLEADVDAVLTELRRVTPGLLREIARFDVDDWTRPVSRLPGEMRTARWLVRQAAHEGVHHVADVAAAALR